MAKRQEIPDILGQARQPVNALDDILSGKPVGPETALIRSQLRYDYSLIPADKRETVQAAAVEIVRNGRQAQDSLIQVGKQLMAVKDMLEHGQFEDWCETEFQMSPRTVQNMMNVARTFEGKSEKFALLGDSTLYMLAAPSTPDAAREQVIAEAEATGSRPSVARVKEVIAQYKPTMTQLAEMIETRPNLKSADLRAAARKRAGHWLYDTAASNAEATWPGAWTQTTLVNALHYVADALDRADRTPTASVVASAATHSRQHGAELAICRICHRPLSDPASAIAGVGPCCAAKRATAAGSGETDEPTISLDDLEVVDSVTVRVAADGTPNMDWEPEEWDAYQRKQQAQQILAPDRSEPTSAAQKRNERIDSVLRRLYAARGAASEFGELTGIYTHGPAFERVMDAMIGTLEANRV